LLKLITGELQPTSGQVVNRPQRIALLSQENQLFEPLTVRELLTIHVPELDSDVIDLLDLKRILDQGMHQLSGGQRQLAWLGFVLQQQPELLLLDEPTTFLDLQFQQRFLHALTTLQARRHMTVLMVIHDLTQALQVSQSMWLLDQTGQVSAEAKESLTDAKKFSHLFNTELTLQQLPSGQKLILPI
jgi:iron complex transport system ATP-binding protein